jgi:hypothetical protein
VTRRKKFRAERMKKIGAIEFVPIYALTINFTFTPVVHWRTMRDALQVPSCRNLFQDYDSDNSDILEFGNKDTKFLQIKCALAVKVNERF